MLPPPVPEPRVVGEVRVGKMVSPDYPEDFSPGEYLIVQIALQWASSRASADDGH
jgi:hypothetical protein